MIEPQAGIDRDPIAHGQRVACKCGRRYELATIDGRDAGYGLKRLPVAIDKPRAGWNDQSLTVLADLHLAANLPLVIGRKQPWLVMTERRLRRSADEGHRADLLWRAVGDARHIVGPARNSRIAAARVVYTRRDEPSDANVPHRVVVQCLRELAEGDGRNRRMLPQRGLERLDQRRALWSRPELVMIALKQLQTRRDKLAAELTPLEQEWGRRT